MLEIRVIRKTDPPNDEMIESGELEYSFIDDEVVNMPSRWARYLKAAQLLGYVDQLLGYVAQLLGYI